MVHAIGAFMDFCYLVRRSQLDEDTLAAIDTAINRFHHKREIFVDVGVHEDFLLPHQHSLVHYHRLIELFGAPNGICLSITESKHIKAVKEPWLRSNRNQPLGQMLLTNQRLEKLAASRVDFVVRGMLDGPSGTPLPSEPPSDAHDNDAEDVPGMTSLGDMKLARYPGMIYLTT
jgi:hypothetical protein